MGSGSLAEMATCQMEFKYLSHLTGDPKYFMNSQKVMDVMEKEQGRTPARIKKTGADGVITEDLTQDGKTGLWTNDFRLTDGQMFGSKSLCDAITMRGVYIRFHQTKYPLARWVIRRTNIC